MHPLILQAAEYESSMLPCEIGISISDTSLEPGDYEFLIYAWKYLGLRPDIKMIAISDHSEVEDNILSYLHYASECSIDSERYQSKWDSMDNLHYELWQGKKADYAKTVSDECNYKLDQVKHSYNQRTVIFRSMINSAEEEKIKRMRQSQLDKLEKDYTIQTRSINETIAKADIHTNLLIKGILHIG